MRNLIRRTAVLTGAVALILGSGIGTAAAAPPTTAVLTFTPSASNYGHVTLGQTKSVTFTLKNTGDRTSGGVKVTLSGSPEFRVTATTCRGTLGPDESCTVTVRFAPARVGTVHAKLKAAGNKHAVPATARLKGTGTTCQVKNADTGHGYTGLQAAVTAAAPGATLSVRGTCIGTTTVGKNLTIAGVGPSPTLDGQSRGGSVSRAACSRSPPASW